MIYFKTPRIQKEYNELPTHNRRLAQLLKALEIFCELEFKKDVTLTEIYRSPDENKAVGGIAVSPHLNWEAADIRSTTFTSDEIERIKTFLNTFRFRNGKQVAVYHAVSTGLHFHIQYAKS